MNKQSKEERNASGLNMGLGLASKKTRLRVARAGGLAVSRDLNHMSKIGRSGGLMHSPKQMSIVSRARWDKTKS